MKIHLASLLLLSTLRAYPQLNSAPHSLTVLLIGTAHTYGPTPVEHFDYPLRKAIRFQPDAVFGEDLSPEDYDALTDYWNKAALEKRVAYVRNHTNTTVPSTEEFMKQTYQLLRQQPEQNQERMKLARSLYLKHDFGNARFQLYRLDAAKSNFSKADNEAYRTILGEPDSLYRSRSNEYHNIFYPLLDSLKQERIYPMDSQQYDKNWQAAWDSLSTKLDRAVAAEPDTNSVNFGVWRSFLTWQTQFQGLHKQVQSAGQMTRTSNTDRYSAQVDSINFGGDLLLHTLKGYPAAEAFQMRHYWQLRNETMCRNIANRSRAIGARRVVVGVGSAHRKTMLDILRTMPDVYVYTLNEYHP